MATKQKSKITVVVLGDVGRSPRMQYHSLSLAQLPDTAVRLVGLKGEACLDDVNASVHVRTIEDVKAFKHAPWIIRAPVRALRNALALLAALVEEPDTEVFLVQNPPAIPTLAVVLVASWWTGGAVIIDWHNLGFKMLDHGDGTRRVSKIKKVLAKLARIYEKYCGKLADAHLCVTRALSEYLESNFRLGSRAVVVYDRPFSAFRRISDGERRTLLIRLAEQAILPQSVSEDILERKVALLVSSTSWTEDEDFGMLLKALDRYAELAKSSSPRLPRIVMVVTGKGPLLREFLPVLDQMKLKTDGVVQVFSAWLAHADYPLFLAASDLGVCMHTSTSGLDLPMKVVDMFGVGLPTCAVSFQCLNELVMDGINGRIFSNEIELSTILSELLAGFPDQSKTLEQIRQGLIIGPGAFEADWQQNWQANVLPVVKRMLKVAKHRPKRRYLFMLGCIFLACVAAVLATVFAYLSS